MEPKEYTAKTVELAIQKACEDLHVTPDKLDIQVLSNGYRGIFGLVGSKEARIIVSLKTEMKTQCNDLLFDRTASPKSRDEQTGSPERSSPEAQHAKEILETILQKMSIPASVHIAQDGDTIQLNINEHNGGLLIGKNGQTLDALQYLVNKIANKIGHHQKRIVLDIQGYRAKRVNSLAEMALRLGRKVKKTHKPVTTALMNPYERRIIHLTLKNDSELATKSQGEGTRRKVVIYPKDMDIH